MSKEEKIKDWLTVARLDWKRIIRNLEDKDSIAAGFYLQQSRSFQKEQQVTALGVCR